MNIGRDHTDWSWYAEHQEAKDVTRETGEDVVTAEVGLAGAVGEYDNVLKQVLNPQVEHQRNCQLHREEEINLYYQCTQLAYNNYALDHFGGDFRSYPAWLSEVWRCNSVLEDAEMHTIYDELHEQYEFPCESETAITLPMPWPFTYQKWTRSATKFDRADGLY